MNTRNMNIAIKMILAGILTIIIAYLLNIKYYTTASAISILSIQISRKDFIEVAIKRLISGLFAIVLSSFMFYYFGQTFLMFSLFLTVFILASWIFKIPEGIVASTVIVTHLLTINQITFNFILEEILLLVIAITIAFFLNMFYPEFDKPKIKKNLIKTDKVIEDQLLKIYHLLTNKEINYQIDTKSELKRIINEAEIQERNMLTVNGSIYLKYLYMRTMQLDILLKIEEQIKSLIISHVYQIKIANLIFDISENISFDNKALFLFEDLKELKDYFKVEPLPKYRYEFELRAVLFIIINELEQFLKLKIDFHNQHKNFLEENINDW